MQESKYASNRIRFLLGFIIFLGSMIGMTESSMAVAFFDNSSSAVMNRESRFLVAQQKLPIFNSRITEETLEKWLKDAGLAVIKSFAANEFPKMQPSEIAALQIGKPVKAYKFADTTDSAGKALISESNLRVAPIFDAQGNAVGVIQVELNKENNDSRKVIGDANFGQHLLPPPANSQQHQDSSKLVYDPALEAWFVVKEKNVEAASASAENIVLGAVPIDVFFAQRKLIISDGATANSLDKQVDEKSEIAKAQQNFSVLVILLAILGIFLVSVFWLIWESKYEKNRDFGASRIIWNWATGHRRILHSKEKERKKIKFSQSSGDVTLYQKPTRNNASKIIHEQEKLPLEKTMSVDKY